MPVTRRTNDILLATIYTLTYQGPASNLYLYTAVAQGGGVRFESPVVQVVMPNTPLPAVIDIADLTMEMRALPGASSPVVGNGDGLVIAALNQNMTSQLYNVNVPHAYDIVAPAATALEAYDLNEVLYTTPDNLQSQCDFAWRRVAGQTRQNEFLDISTVDGLFVDQASYLGINIGSLTLSVDAAGRTRAQQITLTPNTRHYWRVSTQIGGLWYVSQVRTFMSLPVSGGQGGVQAVTNVQVVFS